MESLESKKILKKSKFFVCEICNVTSSRKQDYDTHLLTAKHQRNQVETEKILTISLENFHCIECNFSTLKKSLFDKHINTLKHIQYMNKDADKPTSYCCDNCNKVYLNRSGLYKHKKHCQVLENKTELTNEFREPDEKKPEVTIDLVLDLIKQNKELQTILIEQSKEHSKQMMELAKNQSVTNNNNNTNCNNTQFNLQFFLNETCKDAMNITDFINSLQLTTQDFENTGKVGFIDGISKIIINKLNSVDTTIRPMHCTDAKRETLYIKDENVWEKEDNNKSRFKKVVKQIANKNLHQIVKWKDEHPDCINLDTPDNIAFRKYYKVAVGGESNEEDDKFFEKIKRNVLKEIVVNKTT